VKLKLLLKRLVLGLGFGVLVMVVQVLPVDVLANSQSGVVPLADKQSSLVSSPSPNPWLPSPHRLAPVQVQAQNLARVVQAPLRSQKSVAVQRAAAASGNPLLYQGGYVLNSPRIYVDFWGTEWQASSQASAESYIEGFFGDVGGSSWAETLSQYCSGISPNVSSCPAGANHVHNAAGQLAGFVIDTSPAPTAPTFADIRSEAAALAAYYGYPGGAMFIVYTPSGKSESGFGTSWCGYHSVVQVGSSIFPYAYMPYEPDAGSNCGAYLVSGALDGFSIVGGHEYAEAVTDPFPSTSPGYTGWVDTTIVGGQGEIGDKCAWSPSPGIVAINGHSWPVQSLFSNQALAQGQPPCVFAAGTLPVTAITGIAPTQGSTAGGTSVVVSGANFVAVTAVSFGSVPASFTVSSSSQILATSPPGNGSVDVTVTDANGTTAVGPMDQFTYLGVPGPPTAITAMASNGQVVVGWTTPASNGGSPITDYRVTPYIASVAQTPTLTAGVTQLTVTGLVNGTPYTFTVAAINVIGTSVESSQSNSITPVTTPGAPTGVTAVAGDAQAMVSWTAPINDGGSPIFSYTVECSPACTAVVVGGATFQALVTGLPADTLITFKVTARNLVGPGVPSSLSNSVSIRSSAGQSGRASPAARELVQQSTGNVPPPPR
jgi:hypothetical protein